MLRYWCLCGPPFLSMRLFFAVAKRRASQGEVDRERFSIYGSATPEPSHPVPTARHRACMTKSTKGVYDSSAYDTCRHLPKLLVTPADARRTCVCVCVCFHVPLPNCLTPADTCRKFCDTCRHLPWRVLAPSMVRILFGNRRARCSAPGLREDAIL